MGSVIKNGKAPADDKGTSAQAQAQKPGADLIGETVTVTSRKGSFRHPFSGALVQAGVELTHKFDSFLHGQWLLGRIKVFHNGDEIQSKASATPLPGPVVDPAAKAAALAPTPATVMPIIPASQTDPEKGAVDPAAEAGNKPAEKPAAKADDGAPKPDATDTTKKA